MRRLFAPPLIILCALLFCTLSLCACSGGKNVESATYYYHNAWVAKVNADGSVQWTENTFLANFEEMAGLKAESQVASGEKTGRIPASEVRSLFALIDKNGYAVKREPSGEPHIKLTVQFKNGEKIANFGPSNTWEAEEQKPFAAIEKAFQQALRAAGYTPKYPGFYEKVYDSAK